ncbi:DUF6734 family protein [Flavobacterium sp. IB48]|uniref:DUF6734 family protein n=1 Tax=Flavobacterium sp. IB48 TaxID=2779375 RepID=UPI0018E7F7CC|nr:DUF6734 family protein [Flavobacterium sp. IB48]MBJ2125976.1 hypothetical protein [Flavobacterium sp. IB48]
MKIIQSFWSGNQNNFDNSGGWYSYRYHWMSWILSCHQLIRYHDHVELYTDSFGYKILIEKLKLPYTKVHVTLDEANGYPKDFWAIAKVKTFQKQNEPFLHVDGDVFVWSSLTDQFKNSNLAVQSMEVTDMYYRNIWKDIYPELVYLPEELHKFHNDQSNISYNMGIVGGNNMSFFKDYCEKSIDFVDANKVSWDQINGLHFNVFFEQLLFCKHAESMKQEVEFLFPEMPVDNEYFGFADFHEVPDKTYLHLLGNYKKEPVICKFMESYIMRIYPESYANLGALINEFNGRDSEIEILNSEIVQELLDEFHLELQNDSFDSTRFLLKRDLYSVDLYKKIDVFFNDNRDFKIVKLNGFELKESASDQDCIIIEELNAPFREYELDELDEILLEELKIPVSYFHLAETVKEYLEDDDQESVNEISELLKTKLKNYIKLKIISIHN